MARTSMLRLSSPWSSGAVLQHSSPHQFSGKAAPAQLLQITLQNSNQNYQAETQTDALGAFTITLPPQPPSGPWTLCISAGASDSIELNDLWFGELLLFAGQSNVGWPLARFPDQLAAAQQLLATGSGNHFVRCYLTDPSDFRAAGAWQPLDSNSCPLWPALLYHFSQQLDNMKAPIMCGLVDLSWPGSAIDAWLPSTNNTFEHAWQAGALFSTRLAPWLGQPFQSLVWYQGEQDAMGREAGLYADRLRGWFDSCRQLAGWEFPLLLVQIAGFGTASRPDLANGFVQVRQAQQQVAAITPHCVLVSAADLGAAQDIHPPLKAELARRLALQLHALMLEDDSSTMFPLQAKLHEVTRSVAILQLPKGVDWQQPEWIEGFFAECPSTGWQTVLARFRADQQYIEIDLPPAATRLCYGMAALPTLSLYNTDGLPLLPGIWQLKAD